MSERTQADSSYKQIFKSSVVIGGSQSISVIISMLKNKALALLLGPIGLGIAGVYLSLSSVITNIIGVGIGSSAVRQIAEAQAKENEKNVYSIIKSVRVFLLSTGITTILCIIVFSDLLTQMSFGEHTSNQLKWGVMLLSSAVFFDNLTSGERAILQGLRKLKQLASGQVIGGIIGAIVSITIVYIFKEKGIIWYLISSSLLSFLVTRWLTSKAVVQKDTSYKEIRQELKPLLNLGFVFLVTGLWGNLMAYVIRIIILKEQGLESVGIYQASWSLVTTGFNVVLLALGTDFYPRLVSVSHDVNKVNRTVNEQVEISIYFALPVFAVIYLFAPLAISILYSSEFLNAVGLTRWLICSSFLQVMCWPLGYIIITKGSRRLFLFTSLLWEALHLPLIYFCLKFWGTEGIGISYILSYIIVAFGSTFICKRYFGFKWQSSILKIIVFSSAIVCLFITLNFAPISKLAFYCLGSILIVFIIIQTLKSFQKKLEINLYQRMLKLFGIYK